MLRDDAGRPVRILNPCGFADWPVRGDDRIAGLLRRVTLSLQGRSTLELLAWNFLHGVLGITVFLAIIWLARRMVPGASGWLHVLPAIAAGLWIGVGFFRLRIRYRARAVCAIVLDEGLCPSCGYNFVGLDVDGRTTITCPECAATWHASKVHRRAPFANSAQLGNPLPLVRRQGSSNLWTVVDASGERLDLVHPRLHAALRSTRADRNERVTQRLIAAQQDIARTNKAVRATVLTVLIVVSIAIIALTTRSSMPLGAQIALALIFLGLILWCWRGNFCYRPETVRAALLQQNLCPCCTCELDAANGVGTRRCEHCRAVW